MRAHEEQTQKHRLGHLGDVVKPGWEVEEMSTEVINRIGGGVKVKVRWDRVGQGGAGWGRAGQGVARTK